MGAQRRQVQEWNRDTKKSERTTWENTRKMIQVRQNQTISECIQNFSFVANTEVAVKQNVGILLVTIPTLIYFNRSSNQAFHNLCTREKVPARVQYLLGLGLKFSL
jgi:hypothetical protein